MTAAEAMPCDHCGGIESVHITYTPTLDAIPRPESWQPESGDQLGNVPKCLACVACGCHWTLIWELVEKGKHCPVHGSGKP
jgi:hypothetical protein